MPPKEPVNFRLSKLARDLLKRLSDLDGISQGDVIEVLVRAEIARRGLPLPQNKRQEPGA